MLITDGAGATVGLGEIDTAIGHFSVTPRTCDMTFSAADVPAGEGIYSLKIGQHGAPQYTEAQMQQPLSLSLGP